MILPTLLPTMTLYSATALTQRLNNHSRGENISLKLFGSPWAGLRHDFPSHLDFFCEATGNVFGTPIEVATKATVLPYFVLFRPPQSRDSAIALMRGESVEPLKFLLGLPAGPSGASLPLRYCEECCRKDIAEHGFAYWHREHQLPSAAICVEHGSALTESRLRLDGRGRSGLFLPDDPKVQESAHRTYLGAAQADLMRLARLSSAALTGELPGHYSAFSLQAAYLHGLKQQGLLTSSGRVRATEFLARIQQRYRALSQVHLFARILNNRSLEGMLKLVRKPRGGNHTASHLLLIDFLFGDWDLFLSVYRWEVQMAQPDPDLLEDIPYTSINSMSEPYDESKAQHINGLVSNYLNEQISLTSIAATLGIDINTAMRRLGKLGLLNIRHRPKTVTSAVRQSVIEALMRGESMRQIARAHCLSRSTVDRICNEGPQLPIQWKKANKEWKRQREREKFRCVIAQNPSITLTYLRKIRDSGYSWLAHHDREWLKANMPKPISRQRARPHVRISHVDWTARDAECLAALQSIEASLQLASWERLKPRALLRRLPKLSFSPRLDQLPASRMKVESILMAERIRRDLPF